MTKTREEEGRTRIFVSLDPTAYSRAVLEGVANMAANMQAELHGLFVEDDDLLRLAGLPFAREISYGAAAPRPLDLVQLQRALQSEAEQLQRAVAELAERMSLVWSFHVARGRVIRTSLDAAVEADLLIICRASQKTGLWDRPQLTWATLDNGGGPLLAVCDGTEQSERVLSIAARLLSGRKNRTVVLVATEEDAARKQVKRALELLGQQGIEVAGRLSVANAQQLALASRRARGALLLIGRDTPLLNDAALEMLANDLDCPLGLVA